MQQEGRSLGKKIKNLLFIAIPLICIQWFMWVKISPEELFTSRKFFLDLSRNLTLITCFISLAYLAGKGRYTKYLASLFIFLALLIAFDSYYLMDHFRNAWWPPEEQSTIHEPTSEPNIIFQRNEIPHGTITYNYGYGFTNYINDTIRIELTVKNERLPDVFYITDEYGRRVNTLKDTVEKKNYALFLGCSVTYGLNVADSLTLPAQFEKRNPGFETYNYGIPASGPNQYLARFENEDLSAQIKEQEGIAIYSFFEHHIKRATSDFETYKWNRTTPYYKLKDGKAVYSGSFSNGRWVLSRIFDILKKSYFIRSINFNYPSAISDHQYRTTAAIVAGIRDAYVKQFGNDQFYVFMTPGFDTQILPYFEEYKLKIIDCSECITQFWSKGIYTFPIDNHPTGLAYGIMADSIGARLKKKLD